MRNQQHLLHQLRLQLCNQRAVNRNDNCFCPTELESRIALMVQLIPTRLEYLLMAAATYSVTVKNAAGCISAPTQCNLIRNQQTPAATAAATLQPTCRSNWNDNCDCPTGTGITYSIDGSTYTNTTGIFTNCCNVFSYG
jgi:hypothetical protein